MDLPPYIREVESPLSEDMLAPLPDGCDVVQFNSRLRDSEYEALAALLAPHPNVRLRAYGSYDGSIRDLDFLRFFPFVQRFAADALSDPLHDITGLDYLPDSLKELTLGRTNKRLSLSPLERFHRTPAAES